MKSSLGRYTRAVVFFAVLATIAVLLYVYWTAVSDTMSRHALTALFAGAISAIAIAVQALNFLRLLEEPFKPPLASTVHMWAVANLANYLGPFQPGLAIRLAFFRRYGISLAATAKTTIRQIHLSTWTAMGLATVGVLSEFPTLRIIAVAGACVFLLWPFLLRLLRRNLSTLARHSKTISEQQQRLTAFLSVVPFKDLGLFVAQYLLIACSLFGVYWAFDAPLAPHEALLLAIASALSTLISITPNNLGVQEALFGYVAHLGGLTASEALSVALLFRVSHIGACFFLLIVTLKAR